MFNVRVGVTHPTRTRPRTSNAEPRTAHRRGTRTEKREPGTENDGFAVHPFAAAAFSVAALTALAAGHAATIEASWAAIIDVTAWVAGSVSRPCRTSAASAPMQHSGPNIGATIAPLDMMSPATMRISPRRQATAVALSVVRAIGLSRSSTFVL